MKAVIQRVLRASVSIKGKKVSEIGNGYLVLLGVMEGDGENQADVLAEKLVHLRVMSDDQDKMNKSILDMSGEMLIVSQFTLAADLSSGRRPSFIKAAKPDIAQKMYEYFIRKIKSLGIRKMVTGQFGEYMQVELINDGPVTIIADSQELT